MKKSQYLFQLHNNLSQLLNIIFSAAHQLSNIPGAGLWKPDDWGRGSSTRGLQLLQPLPQHPLCQSCEIIFSPKKYFTPFQFYGVPPGAETIEEQALREASISFSFIWQCENGKQTNKEGFFQGTGES